MLYVEDVRDLVTDGGGIEIDASSEPVSVMLGSAYRLFLETVEEELEVDRLCGAGIPVFNLGIVTGMLLGLGLGSRVC
jgi:hypothetical protein